MRSLFAKVHHVSTQWRTRSVFDIILKLILSPSSCTEAGYCLTVKKYQFQERCTLKTGVKSSPVLGKYPQKWYDFILISRDSSPEARIIYSDQLEIFIEWEGQLPDLTPTHKSPEDLRPPHQSTRTESIVDYSSMISAAIIHLF